MRHNGKIIDTFKTETPLTFAPAISIETTLFGGTAGAAGCSSSEETYSDLEGSAITYCYIIANTGNTVLDNMIFSDTVGSNQSGELSGIFLAPGDSILLHFQTTIQQSMTNQGTITANPSLSNGLDLSTLADVSDTDPANVQKILSSPPTNSPTNVPTLAPTKIPTNAPSFMPSAGPSIPPTPLPTVRPSKSPTSGPSVQPSSSPTYGKDRIDDVDQCKQIVNTFQKTTVMMHFAFLSHTTECLHAKVYVSEQPITDEEIAAGELERHWTFMCDAKVQGKGSAALTYVDANDCAPHYAHAGKTYYFYTTIKYVDAAAHCSVEATEWEYYERMAEVRESDESRCSDTN